VVVAVLAAGLGVLLAIALSFLFPIGIAQRADLDGGLDADPLVLGIGAVTLIGGLVGWAMFVAWRATAWRARGETRRRVSAIGAAAARAGAPASTVTGIRMALERGRGQTTVPVIGAVVATTAGVVLLSAILVFSASLDRLVATPELEGWTWDATVGNINELAVAEEVEQALRANERVESFVGLASGPITVDGEEVSTIALGRREGAAGPIAVEGRLPAGADEIAFGGQTLGDLGREVGDTVRVSAEPGMPETEARIVGTVIPPATLEPQMTLGRGAVMSAQGIRQVYGGEPFVPNTYLVHFTDDTTLDAGVASLQQDFPETVGTFQLAEDVLNLQRVYRLPRDLAILVAAVALATLASALFTSVRRRRRDLATLSTLGFGRRELRSTVAWQATTFAVVALALGIPIGIALGRQVWTLTVASIGLDTSPDLPVGVLTVIAVGAILAANVVAFVPGRSAARTHPAEILHTE
jgi:ABC-type lipoprotein release transport system permease subunit